ncbi:hypothetical protein A2974_02325 [Candidatus Peregrinibacteria bacterium RIFCSPLOWO2_01_FULL_48_20]|nr:MAG: hypothetical protein A2974_02325 [Candidatus Peregrinibacteria bacterium RIFCSPLOWO2_01_FULL_48_20]
MLPDGYKHIEVLDTVIFYPEHVEGLSRLMKIGQANIEQVPLHWQEGEKAWSVPCDYKPNSEANIRMWPSSLPESIAKISDAHLRTLGNIQCWTEADLRGNRTAQFMLNQTRDADGVVTCWTAIPDEVLKAWIKRGGMKSIICWTHEFEHRMNVTLARNAGINVDSIPDYGTDAVAELNIGGLVELMRRNHGTKEKAYTGSDMILGVLGELFGRLRGFLKNEKNTRRGRFSHHFHKLGRSADAYAAMIHGDKKPEEVIPERLLRGKKIYIMDDLPEGAALETILQDGFGMIILADKAAIQSDKDSFVVCDAQRHARELDGLSPEQIIDWGVMKHIGDSMNGKTFGVVGLGRIGTRTAEIAQRLGMKVTYASPNTFDARFEATNLTTLFEEADVVSITVAPHKAQGLVGEALMKRLKPCAYFLNTSDGNAVDEGPLNARLQDGTIHAMLDVYQGLPTGKALGLSADTRSKIGENLATNIFCYRAGWKTMESIGEKTWRLIQKLENGLK